MVIANDACLALQSLLFNGGALADTGVDGGGGRPLQFSQKKVKTGKSSAE